MFSLPILFFIYLQKNILDVIACSGDSYGGECIICIINCEICATDSTCQVCFPQYFVSSSADSCLPCSSSCLQCEIQAERCTSCHSPKYFFNYDCLDVCPDGLYPDDNLKICKACPAECSTCLDSSTCSTCKSGYYLDGTQCLPCHSSCLECTSISTCSKCNSAFFFYDNFCFPFCPQGTFLVPYANYCEICHTSCKNCSHSFDRCFFCISTKYLFDYQCLDTCPIGWYADENRICRACKPECLTCTNSFTCSSCQNGYYMNGSICSLCHPFCLECNSFSVCSKCIYPFYFYQNFCFSICPEKTFIALSDSNHCENCHPSCKTCSENYDQCSSCFEGYYLEDNACHVCSDNCLACIDSWNCLSCKTPYLLTLDTKKCDFLFCPDEYYFDMNGDCKRCKNPCRTCFGSSAFDCTSCLESYGLRESVCLLCDSNCKECVDDNTKCISCRSPLLLYNFRCIENCPNGYLTDSSGSICLSCDSNCLTCDFEIDHCLSCESSKYLSIENKCVSCDVQCKGCMNSSDNCLNCAENYFDFENRCIQECPDEYYQDKTDFKCKKCSAACKSCFGPLDNQCNSCINTHLLITNNCYPCNQACLTCFGLLPNECLQCKNNLYLENNECKLICSKNYFLEQISFRSCIKCHEKCDECLGTTESDCKNCQNPFNYLKIIDRTLNLGQCYSKCPINFVSNPRTMKCEEGCESDQYLNNDLNVCMDCHGLCHDCTGPTAYDCITCKDKLKIKFLNECLDACPKGYYLNQIEKRCIPCSIECIDCSNQEICIECQEGYYFFAKRNICTKCEQKGFYIDRIQNLCFPCKNHCLSCIADNICLECDFLSIRKGFTCFEKIIINTEMIALDKLNTVMLLSFNNSWPSLFYNIISNTTQYIDVRIENLDEKNYSCEVYTSSLLTKRYLEIYIKLKVNLKNDSLMTISLRPEREEEYQIDGKIFSFKLVKTPICGELQVLDFDLNICKNLPLINWNLKQLNVTMLEIKFSDRFDDLFKILNDVLNITIIGLSNFTFNLFSYDDPLVFSIKLIFHNYFEDWKTLKFSLNIPLTIEYHTDFRLSKKEETIQLMPNSNKNIISEITKINSFVKNGLEMIILLNLLIDFKSFNFHSLNSLILIDILKYVDIDYPQILMQIFSEEYNFFSRKIFNQKQNKQLTQRKFLYYENDPYFINNLDGRSTFVLLLASISLIIGILSYFLRKIKSFCLSSEFFNNAIARKLFHIFYINLFLSFFASYNPLLLKCCLINIYWYDLNSNEGKMNFSISILILSISIILLLSLFYKFFQLHLTFKKIRDTIKNNLSFNPKKASFVVFPDEENNLEEKKYAQSSLEEKKYAHQINKNDRVDIIMNGFKKRSLFFRALLNPMIRQIIYGEEVDFKTCKIIYSENDWKNLYQPYQSYNALWKDFKKKKFSQLISPLLNILRSFFLISFIVICNNFPYLTSLLCVMINYVFLSLQFLTNPYRNKKEFTFKLVLDIGVSICYTSVFFISHYQKYYDNNEYIVFHVYFFFFVDLMLLSFTILHNIGYIIVYFYNVFKRIREMRLLDFLRRNKIHNLLKK